MSAPCSLQHAMDVLESLGLMFYLRTCTVPVTRPDRHVKLGHRQPSVHRCNSSHDDWEPCVPVRIDRRWTGTRAVAERLNVVAPALARIPLIDDHLHRPVANPNAACVFLLVNSYRESAGDRVRVNRKSWWNTQPRGRSCFVGNLTSTDMGNLVEFSDLKRRVRNRQLFTGDHVAPGTVFWCEYRVSCSHNLLN
jgi:hypothetical protein